MFQCCWVNQIFAVCEEMLSRVTKAAGSDTIQMGSAYSNLVSENITHTDPWLWSAHIFMSSGEGFDSLDEPSAGQLTFGQNEPDSQFQNDAVFKQTRYIMYSCERVSLTCVYHRHVFPTLYLPSMCFNPDSLSLFFLVNQVMNLYYNNYKALHS